MERCSNMFFLHNTRNTHMVEEEVSVFIFDAEFSKFYRCLFIKSYSIQYTPNVINEFHLNAYFKRI